MVDTICDVATAPPNISDWDVAWLSPVVVPQVVPTAVLFTSDVPWVSAEEIVVPPPRLHDVPLPVDVDVA